MAESDRSSLWIALVLVGMSALVGALLGILQTIAFAAADRLGFISGAFLVGGYIVFEAALSSLTLTGPAVSMLVRIFCFVTLMAGFFFVRSTFGPGGWHLP